MESGKSEKNNNNNNQTMDTDGNLVAYPTLEDLVESEEVSAFKGTLSEEEILLGTSQQSEVKPVPSMGSEGKVFTNVFVVVIVWFCKHCFTFPNNFSSFSFSDATVSKCFFSIIWPLKFTFSSCDA